MIEAWLPHVDEGHSLVAIVVAVLGAPFLMRRKRQGAFDLVTSYCTALLLALTVVFLADIVLTAAAADGLDGVRALDRDSFTVVLPFIAAGLCVEMVRRLDGARTFATATAAVLLTGMALVADRTMELTMSWIAQI